MFINRRILLITMLLHIGFSVAGLSGIGYAAAETRAGSGKPSASIIGTWHSANGSLTFNANSTIMYKGKRYYYAVSSGGLIQLTRKNSSLTIPYQLAGGKLILTTNGKPTVYNRKK